MQKLSGQKIQIIDKKGQNVPVPVTPKKGLFFFGLFASSGTEVRGKTTTTSLKEPLLKGSHVNISRADLDAVKNWVGLEEKIVHDYKEQKTALFKRPAPLSKVPEKPISPAFETFSTQTTVSISPSAPRLKTPSRGFQKTSPGLKEGLWMLGWLVAGGLVFFYVQGVVSNREALQQFTRLQNEKAQLEQSYAGLEKASAGQGAEIEGLNRQLRDMAGELRAANSKKVPSDRDGEKKYRGELMRITIQYETQLSVLREAVQTQDAIVNALKAQIQAFESIVEQARMAAISGVASRFFQQTSFKTGIPMAQGKVIQVNGRYGFIVIDLGAEQGASSGRGITISRDGVLFADGRVDRPYPTTSAAIIHNTGMLPAVRVGDTVSFS